MGLFLPDAKISSVHGQAIWVKGRLVVPMFHPAAALHQQSLRPTLEKDFSRLPELIAKAMELAAGKQGKGGGRETQDRSETIELVLKKE